MVRAVKRAGFTLIELLVVIAILALLLAIIVPAMRKVKMQAQRVVSQNNMRQIGIAISLYADDNSGFFPLTTHIESDEEKTWIYTLAPYLGDVDAVRICPADPQGKARLEYNTTSYIINVYMNPLYELAGLIVSESFHNLYRLKSPSQTITTFVAADDMPADDTHADHTHSRSWFDSGDPDLHWAAVIGDIQPDRYKAGRSDEIDMKGSTLFLYADTQVAEIKAETIKTWAAGTDNFAKPPH